MDNNIPIDRQNIDNLKDDSEMESLEEEQNDE